MDDNLPVERRFNGSNILITISLRVKQRGFYITTNYIVKREIST